MDFAPDLDGKISLVQQILNIFSMRYQAFWFKVVQATPLVWVGHLIIE